MDHRLRPEAVRRLERFGLVPVDRWAVIDHEGPLRGAADRSGPPTRTTSRYGLYPAAEGESDADLEAVHGGHAVASFGTQSEAMDEIDRLRAIEQVMDEVPDPADLDREEAARLAAARRDRVRRAGSWVQHALEDADLSSGANGRPRLRPEAVEELNRVLAAYGYRLEPLGPDELVLG